MALLTESDEILLTESSDPLFAENESGVLFEPLWGTATLGITATARLAFGTLKVLHEAAYRSVVQALHRASYGSDAISRLHETNWTLEGQAFHQSLYTSVSAIAATQLHQALYASLGGATSVFSKHDTSYASLGGLSQVFSLHETSWTVTPDIRQLHATSWKSVIAAQQLHRSIWSSTMDNFALHQVRYRSINTTPMITDGLVYVRV